VEAAANSPNRTSRLGVIHFLIWMAGCGAVLAIYRLNAPAHPTLEDALRQLGLGLAYGTAASGMGLFLWRWRTGSGPLPTQPGHWLLVFGAIGMALDFATSGVYLTALHLGLRVTFVGYLFQQLAAWGTATLIGVAVLARLRASAAWTAAASIVVIGISLIAAADVASLLGIAVGSGTWTYYAPVWAHVVVTALVLPGIWAAELSDRLRGIPRDWLHLAGIASTSVLGLVNIAMSLMLALKP